MALKPRTFRRIILLGSFVSVLLLVAALYFVVRPWQNQRQIDIMRVDGMAAADSGKHIEAVEKLGRYLRRSPGAAPEYHLAHARSRLKYQSSDRGHVQVAIQSYREYLKAVPDDVDVAKELLPLFNDRGMYIEALALADILRTNYSDTSIEVLREVLFAHDKRGSDADVVDELFVELFERDDVGFEDMYQYVKWMSDQDRYDEARTLIASRVDSGIDDVHTKLIAFWVKDLGSSPIQDQAFAQTQVAELSSMLGLDPDAGEWVAEPEFLEPVTMVAIIDLVFNVYERQDLSLLVRKASARINHDTTSLSWTARRLYWNHDFDNLYQALFLNDEGEVVPDVLGYQALARRQSGDEDELGVLFDQLRAIDLDFRAQSWLDVFEGLDLLENNQSTQARTLVLNAIEVHGGDPVYSLVMGDIYAKQGQLVYAHEQWDIAHAQSNNVFGNLHWVDPYIRIINAYTKAERLPEVVSYVDDLMSKVAPRNPISTLIAMRSYASLARSNDLEYAQVLKLLSRFEQVLDLLVPTEKLLLSADIATLYASIGRTDEAIALLSEAVATSPERQILLGLLAVDQHYQLGVAESAGIDVGVISVTTPSSALGYALREYSKDQSVESGLAVIDRGAIDSEGEIADQWQRMRARYLDATIDPIDPKDTTGESDLRAINAWEALESEHPDDIELLYQIAESNALSMDIERVDTVIDKIVAITQTKGRVLPSRLRLARASAIAGRGATKRANRDEALKIVRAVVVNDGENFLARNMLGRLLDMRPSPELSNPEDLFEPDLEGAINEYLTISRQLKGRGAQKYLLQAVDLSLQLNDDESARQYLFEFDSRFSNDFQILPEVARRLENLNDLQTASAIYSRIYQRSENAQQTIRAGLSLVNVYIAQGQRGSANGLLRDLSEEPELESDQVFELASLYAKNGYKPEGDQIAENGTRYGLDPIESKLVYARYAGTYISSEIYEATLREVVSEDPTQEQAWLMLLRQVIRDQRFEEAQGLVERAIASLPDSKDLIAMKVLAQGDFESARSLIESGAIESNAIIDEAVRLVDEYMASMDSASSEEQRLKLIAMLDKFGAFLPIQRFAMSHLNELSAAAPQLVAEYGDRASKFFPSDSLLMRITIEAYLRADEPHEAIRIAKLWRTNVLGSPMEADVLIAQAYIQLQRYTEVSEALRPYVSGATEQSDTILSAKVLYGYSHARLKLGEDPRVTADRLEPLLLIEGGFGKQVWLNLIRDSVPTHEEAARWLEIVDGSIEADQKLAIAKLWLVTLDRFEAREPRYAQASIDVLNTLVESEPTNLVYLNTLAQAHGAFASSLEDQDLQRVSYQRAISILDQANDLDPTNLAYLAQGASYATRALDFDGAETRYRRLLALDLDPSPFLASIKNNLAMLIERQSDDADKLKEAHQLSIEATEIMGHPSFWGTRGWVELALKQFEQAEASFTNCVDQDQLNHEGWVGLSIAQYLLGEDRAEDAASSFARLKAISDADSINDDLIDRIRNQGDPEWIPLLNE